MCSPSPAPEEVVWAQTGAAGASSSTREIAGAGWGPLNWDPSIFDQGHEIIEGIKRQQLGFASCYNGVRQQLVAAQRRLDGTREEVEERRQERARLQEEIRVAQQVRAEASEPLVPEAHIQHQLQDLRMEHQQVLESLEAACLRTKGEHHEALRGFQERLGEKSGLISNYSTEIQQLRQQLGEQATLDEENSEKEAEISKLKDELRGQKAGTELARRNHTKLGSQRQESTALFRRLAEVGNESLSKLGVPPAAIDGSDIRTLIPFFTEFMGRWMATEDRIRSFGDRQVSVAASQAASAILPRVPQAYPEFPFETIFNDWSSEENKEEHANAVSRFVDEMVAQMMGQAHAGEEEEEVTTEETPAAETTTPEAPPCSRSLDSAPTEADKRGRTDTAPATPSKKPHTRASASARQTGTGASGAATMLAADPILVEEEPAAGATALDSLAAAREKANKEHEEVLATAHARLNENNELVSSYSSQLQALRTKLEEQAKAAEDAAATSTRQEKELNSAKEKSAHLESELSTARGELVKAGEDNVSKAKEIGRLAELLRKAKHASVSNQSDFFFGVLYQIRAE
ncbi:uncharacterized protein LOC104584116 [Brachypodium distachyon]|uniref:uncharacterized protein LOC104584116 n=1 Tax=Brachypodium distachyon TaxID=15368 RepID=UPI00071CF79B|nr:uncharacterized protein LOC104584116 [Brachypodium distachyon]|eukprot:XP_010236557.2 uncharacterized protein LOC104584116 [Brachypodium distachyon]